MGRDAAGDSLTILKMALSVACLVDPRNMRIPGWRADPDRVAELPPLHRESFRFQDTFCRRAGGSRSAGSLAALRHFQAVPGAL
jgi:hypothetical protein